MASTDILGSYTLMDVVNSYTSLDAKGTYLWAANIMARKCPFFRDMPLVASNQIMSNIDARRTYLSTPGTRRFNEGVAPSASHKVPFTDPIAMVEDYSEVDYSLWKIQNDPAAWRADEDKAKVESMTQKMEDLILYGSIATDPGAFNGLAVRFASSTARPNGDSTWPYNVQLGGGSGSDTASIWLIEWGTTKVFGIYPKNTVAGIHIEDLGKVTVNTNSLAVPKYMEALRTHFSCYLGIVVKDERCVQRVANLECSGASNVFDEDALITAINRLPSAGQSGGEKIYVSRSIKTQMDIRAKDKNNVYYTQDGGGDVWGRRVTRFQGIPVEMAEMMDETETAIS